MWEEVLLIKKYDEFDHIKNCDSLQKRFKNLSLSIKTLFKYILWLIFIKIKTYFTISDDLTRVVMQKRIFFIPNRVSENYFWRIFWWRLTLKKLFLNFSQQKKKLQIFLFFLFNWGPITKSGTLLDNKVKQYDENYDRFRSAENTQTSPYAKKLKIDFLEKFNHTNHASDSFQIQNCSHLDHGHAKVRGRKMWLFRQVWLIGWLWLFG